MDVHRICNIVEKGHNMYMDISTDITYQVWGSLHALTINVHMIDTSGAFHNNTLWVMTTLSGLSLLVYVHVFV